MKKILITGGTGLMALNWAITMRHKYRIILGLHKRNLSLDGVDTIQLNLDCEKSILQTIEDVRPQLIIHAAGLTSVESCEEFPEVAYQTNVVLAGNIARAAANRSIKLVHISTDHLFDGTKEMVDENSEICPLNVYSKTKAEAELEVESINPDALIVRTNFYGWGTSYRCSFSDMIISSLKANKSITLFSDVFYTPIIVSKLAETINELVKYNKSGIYNIVSDDSISKYLFGLKLAKKFNLNDKLITSGDLSDNKNLIQRPKNMTLSNAKVCSELGHSLGSIAEHIELLFVQSTKNLNKELLDL